MAHDDVRRHIVASYLANVSTRTLDDPLALDELEHVLALSTDVNGHPRPGLEREHADAALLMAERLERRAQLEAARRVPSLREAL